MLPLGDELFTSMNPFAAKIWIGARDVRHSSTCGTRTTIVPSRVLPEPAKRRCACSPGPDAVWWVVLDEVVVGVVEPAGAFALVLAACAGVGRVPEEAPLFARALP